MSPHSTTFRDYSPEGKRGYSKRVPDEIWEPLASFIRQNYHKLTAEQMRSKVSSQSGRHITIGQLNRYYRLNGYVKYKISTMKTAVAQPHPRSSMVPGHMALYTVPGDEHYSGPYLKFMPIERRVNADRLWEVRQSQHCVMLAYAGRGLISNMGQNSSSDMLHANTLDRLTTKLAIKAAWQLSKLVQSGYDGLLFFDTDFDRTSHGRDMGADIVMLIQHILCKNIEMWQYDMSMVHASIYLAVDALTHLDDGRAAVYFHGACTILQNIKDRHPFKTVRSEDFEKHLKETHRILGALQRGSLNVFQEIYREELAADLLIEPVVYQLPLGRKPSSDGNRWRQTESNRCI